MVFTIVLAIVAAIALVQIFELRRARLAEVFAEVGRRWDASEMITTRVAIDQLGTSGLRSYIEDHFNNRDERYYELLREPGFMEDLAILARRKVIKLDRLADSMGLLVIERWKLWAPTAVRLRAPDLRDAGDVFKEFEWLASEMEKIRAKRQT
jgi:hypothetical protein